METHFFVRFLELVLTKCRRLKYVIIDKVLQIYNKSSSILYIKLQQERQKHITHSHATKFSARVY